MVGISYQEALSSQVFCLSQVVVANFGVFRPLIQRSSQIWLPLAVNILDPQWLDYTYVEQLVVGGIKVSDALVGHPVDAVNPEFGQTNGTVT